MKNEKALPSVSPEVTESIHARLTAAQWRNEAIERCAEIADRYEQPFAAADMRAMKSATHVPKAVPSAEPVAPKWTKTPENTPCEWYDKNCGPHSLVDIAGGGKRCQNCKHEFFVAEPVAPKDGVKQGRHISGGCKDYTVGNQTFAVWDEHGDLIQLSERQAKAMAKALAEPVAEDRTEYEGIRSLREFVASRQSAAPELKGQEDGNKTAAVRPRLDFRGWWRRIGEGYDPDGSEVPWYDKRKFLAEKAFDIGIAQSTNYTADDAVYPTEMAFANGRRISIRFENGRPYLHLQAEDQLRITAQSEPVPSPAQPAKELK